ncbi:hypothetical protein DGo_PB0308 (plasmid) [Deinococcus gobiensis I-0]|uniref:Uncharacterized protein n=1 Tax=Deinococcus gobiensis (strain DSM 21396 / JCM 16679 / CGMCC 1.7299 / I-0) TaxID=745776 RepID=H8H230_DEIGI|nr:hypothetical protein DGo_PB0308 [Deinococcus gobiensis I-0]
MELSPILLLCRRLHRAESLRLDLLTHNQEPTDLRDVQQ